MSYTGETTSNYYLVKEGYATVACIWVCFSCGEMFDGELCYSFTGECYQCYPRPDRMKVIE